MDKGNRQQYLKILVSQVLVSQGYVGMHEGF